MPPVIPRSSRIASYWGLSYRGLSRKAKLLPLTDDVKTRPSRPASVRVVGAGLIAASVVLGTLLCFVLLYERKADIAAHTLLLFFLGLALTAIWLPASAPQGQRIGLLPCITLAALLLLPPVTAVLVSFFANTLYAATREILAARRGILDRGLCLTVAGLAGGVLCHFHGGRHFGMAIALYCVLYSGCRLIGLRRRGTRGRNAWRQIRGGWQWETLALIASIPPALLMALFASRLGFEGVAAIAGLVALLLVVAHFGFEVVGLREQVRALEKISVVTLSQTNPNRVIERFLQLSTGLLSCDRVALWLTDDSHTRLDRFQPRASATGSAAIRAEEEQASVRFGEGLVGRVADRRSPLIVRDGARDPRLADAEAPQKIESPFSLLLLPLVADGETVGVAQFRRDAHGAFSQRDAARVRSLASMAAATIANVRMHQDVYNQSVTDGLTGLFNRRHMQSALLDERRRAERYGRTLSVIMLDVDGFKQYNDTFGHPQGDVLLKMMAGLLRERVRSVDIIGRYGGEEFIILMPETTKEEGWRTAERLRQSVANASFPGHAVDPEHTVTKTISLGLATYPQDTHDTQSLIALADAALYHAKRAGRNQTVLAEALVPEDLSRS